MKAACNVPSYFTCSARKKKPDVYNNNYCQSIKQINVCLIQNQILANYIFWFYNTIRQRTTGTEIIQTFHVHRGVSDRHFFFCSSYLLAL